MITIGDLYLDRVLTSVAGAATGVVTSDGSQSVMVLCLSVQRREDVDLSLKQRRRDN